MEREIINIDNDKCDGCGLCIPNCHEGALQIIDEKAVLISDLMCDGLGACLGHCPQGALTIEKREAEAYDEVAVMKEMIQKGQNVVVAHMKHLKDHEEHGFLKQGVQYLLDNKHKLEFNPVDVIQAVHSHGKPESLTGSAAAGGNGSDHNHHGVQVEGLSPDPASMEAGSACGCAGSKEMSFQPGGEQAQQTGEQSITADQPIVLHMPWGISIPAIFRINPWLLPVRNLTAIWKSTSRR